MPDHPDLPYATKSVDLGGGLSLVVPRDVPDDARADQLRTLYGAHVRPLREGGHWKEACCAEVDAALVVDVCEAMNFMGSIVDGERTLAGGRIRLSSRGYWAHGFA